MKNSQWAFSAAILFAVFQLSQAGASVSLMAAPNLVGTAVEPGQCTTVTTTPVIALAAGRRTGWCLYTDDGNTDEVRFTLGPTASSTVGFILNADRNFCDGSEGSVYVGPVYIAAESGTQTFCTLAY